MRGQILWTTAVILCGLTAGIKWGAGSSEQLGEVVPENMAASLRGGACPVQWACAKVSDQECADGVKKDSQGHDCSMKAVVATDPVNGFYYYSECGAKADYCKKAKSDGGCMVYCAGTTKYCQVWPDKITTPCGG